MIAEIPLTSEASQSFTIQLGELKYKLDVKYNDRSGVWTLDMQEDASGIVLFKGSPLVVGEDVLEPYNYAIGTLAMLDSSSQLKDATADDIGSRVFLYYVSPDEVISA
jgi:hypothetical protein